MKTRKTVKFSLTLATVIMLAVAFGACQGPDHNPSGPVSALGGGGGGGGVPTLNQCADRLDNDVDGMADRYGVPPHCTVGLPTQVTNRGSRVTFIATGEYDEAAADTYTVTVTAAGGSGVATVSVTSILGNNSPTNALVTDNVPIFIGSRGVVIIFTDAAGAFNLVLGEAWTVRVKDFNNCLSRPDLACYLPDATVERSQCEDEIDNDYDTKIDIITGIVDPQCIWNCTAAIVLDPGWLSEFFVFTPQCNDGVDNDNDLFIDDLANDGCVNNCVPFEK